MTKTVSGTLGRRSLALEQKAEVVMAHCAMREIGAPFTHPRLVWIEDCPLLMPTLGQLRYLHTYVLKSDQIAKTTAKKALVMMMQVEGFTGSSTSESLRKSTESLGMRSSSALSLLWSEMGFDETRADLLNSLKADRDGVDMEDLGRYSKAMEAIVAVCNRHPKLTADDVLSGSPSWYDEEQEEALPAVWQWDRCTQMPENIADLHPNEPLSVPGMDLADGYRPFPGVEALLSAVSGLHQKHLYQVYGELLRFRGTLLPRELGDESMRYDWTHIPCVRNKPASAKWRVGRMLKEKGVLWPLFSEMADGSLYSRENVQLDGNVLRQAILLPAVSLSTSVRRRFLVLRARVDTVLEVLGERLGISTAVNDDESTHDIVSDTGRLPIPTEEDLPKIVEIATSSPQLLKTLLSKSWICLRNALLLSHGSVSVLGRISKRQIQVVDESVAARLAEHHFSYSATTQQYLLWKTVAGEESNGLTSRHNGDMPVDKIAIYVERMKQLIALMGENEEALLVQRDRLRSEVLLLGASLASQEAEELLIIERKLQLMSVSFGSSVRFVQKHDVVRQLLDKFSSGNGVPVLEGLPIGDRRVELMNKIAERIHVDEYWELTSLAEKLERTLSFFQRKVDKIKEQIRDFRDSGVRNLSHSEQEQMLSCEQDIKRIVAQKETHAIRLAAVRRKMKVAVKKEVNCAGKRRREKKAQTIAEAPFTW